MKIGYSINDIVPKAMMESKSPKAKLGYAKHLMECVGKRVVLEGTALVNSTLNRIADNTISKLQSQGQGDAIGFNALVTLSDRLDKLTESIKKQYITEQDPTTKEALSKAFMSYVLFPSATEDKILKKAFTESKVSQGNRLVNFVKSVLMQISSTSKTPILDFKNTVSRLKTDLTRIFSNSNLGALDGYKETLIGTGGLIDTLDSIVDEFVSSEKEINQIMNPSYSRPSGQAFNNANIPDNAISGHQTNHLYEAQASFMEAFAESLSYFSRRKA